MAKESESQENIEAAERIQRQRLATAQYLYRRGKDIERWYAKEDEDPSQWEIALTPRDPEDTDQWCVTAHPCGTAPKLQPKPAPPMLNVSRLLRIWSSSIQ